MSRRTRPSNLSTLAKTSSLTGEEEEHLHPKASDNSTTRKRMDAFWGLPLVYGATVFFGTFLSEVIDLPQTILSDKRNPLNVWFVKLGWAWTMTPLVLHILIRTISNGHSPKQPISQQLRQPLLRLSFATLYWLFLTQWFFHLIFASNGSCSSVPRVSHKVNTHSSSSSSSTLLHDLGFKECKNTGYTWLGFDISGHCFILIHSSLVLASELRIYPPRLSLSSFTRASSTSSSSSSPNINLSKLAHLSQLILGPLFVFLFILWYMMLVITSLYFHHWGEKVVGTLFGVAFWLVFYGPGGVFRRVGMMDECRKNLDDAIVSLVE